MKTIVTLAFLCYASIGSFCMMPMAMAAEMPAGHHMDAMEHMMTPLSHADCDHCPHHEDGKKPMSHASSCAGHCLSQAISNNPSTIIRGSAQLLAALPPTIPVEWTAVEGILQEPQIHASPPLTSTDFFVLRL